MWESPQYKFNQLVRAESDGTRLYREIVINVTKSAPTFMAPGKTLGTALRLVLRRSGLTRSAEILDFGAGKLRNAVYLLEKGYRVCAVEYKDLFDESAQAAALWKRAKRFRHRFSTLEYPHQFLGSSGRFDLAILINVLNIMPVPAERLLVLQHCYRKLQPAAHLLWYTQRGDADYIDRLVPAYRIGDGYYVGRGSKLKTFYREFTVAEIDALLGSAGFEFVQAIPASPRNQARLYRKGKVSPLADVLDAVMIETARVVDESIPIPKAVKPRVVRSETRKSKGNPDPDSLKLANLYETKLASIPAGKAHARQYQEHVAEMLRLLFPHELHDVRLEQTVFGGIKRLDILASNKSRTGFFFSLKSDHQLVCPTIVIECKNYRHDMSNPEFDQLGSRLGRKLGMVGILAFRKAADSAAVIRRCRSFFDNDTKLIIPLSDADFALLLRMKADTNEDKIETFLDRRVLEVKAG
jgi:SAM-dependent methyltransferase